MGCGVSVSLHFTNISFEMKQDSICPSYFINISFQMKGHRPWAVESLFLLHFIMCHGLRSLYFFTFQHFFRMKGNCPWAAESVFPIHFTHIFLRMKGHRPWAVESLFPLHFTDNSFQKVYIFPLRFISICFRNEKELTMGCGVSIPPYISQIFLFKRFYIPFTVHKYLFSK